MWVFVLIDNGGIDADPNSGKLERLFVCAVRVLMVSIAQLKHLNKSMSEVCGNPLIDADQ